MLKNKKIGFIGGGNMAQAIIAGLLNKKTIVPESIFVLEKISERAQFLKEEFHITCSESSSDLVKHSDVIILAVKPQNFAEAMAQMGTVPAGKLVISILAGTPTKKIEAALGTDVRLVRVMPNTPALVGEGMSGISAGTYATQQDLNLTVYIFTKLGKAIVVPESMLDLVTGVSGSGPAYVFYLIEGMRDAAVSLGMEKEHADLLVKQTFLGSLKLLEQTKEDPAQLRAKVTSKGGTTEQGIRVFEDSNIKDILFKAIKSAMSRSKELSGDAQHN